MRKKPWSEGQRLRSSDGVVHIIGPVDVGGWARTPFVMCEYVDDGGDVLYEAFRTTRAIATCMQCLAQEVRLR